MQVPSNVLLTTLDFIVNNNTPQNGVKSCLIGNGKRPMAFLFGRIHEDLDGQGALSRPLQGYGPEVGSARPIDDLPAITVGDDPAVVLVLGHGLKPLSVQWPIDVYGHREVGAALIIEDGVEARGRRVFGFRDGPYLHARPGFFGAKVDPLFQKEVLGTFRRGEGIKY